MHKSYINLIELNSGSIHLDVRRANPKEYPFHLHTCSSSSSSSGNNNHCNGMIMLSVAGLNVESLHLERTLAYLSCPGASPPLVRLDLTKTCLQGPGILWRLRHVLKVQKLLQTVDFSWNKLGGGSSSSDGSSSNNNNNNALLVQVLQLLMGNESIQQLYLYGNDIADSADLQALGDLLIYNLALRELHLGSNQLLGLHCAHQLARGLSHPQCSLLELDLWCCRLGDDAGAILIRDGVQKNTTLQVLRLNLNDLSYKSCKAITDMLGENQTLQILNLDSNDQLFSSKRKNGGDDGYDKHAHEAVGLAFTRVMGKKNTGLRHLGLPHTGMTDQVAAALFQNLQDNDTLRYLDIGYNNTIDRQGYAQMIESIPQLRALQFLRTHARSQIMNVAQLVTNLGRNTSLLRLTYICVGSVQDQNQMDDYFKRNKNLLQARTIAQNVSTTRYIAAAKTSMRQPLEEACTVPLGLWTKALHKFASPQSSSSSTTTSSSSSSSCTSALYTIIQGQVPTWIQQYQQAKHEEAAATAAAVLKKEEAAATALKEQQQEEEQKAAALQKGQTSTFKIKSRLLKRRLLSPPRR